MRNDATHFMWSHLRRMVRSQTDGFREKTQSRVTVRELSLSLSRPHILDVERMHITDR